MENIIQTLVAISLLFLNATLIFFCVLFSIYINVMAKKENVSPFQFLDPQTSTTTKTEDKKIKKIIVEHADPKMTGGVARGATIIREENEDAGPE